MAKRSIKYYKGNEKVPGESVAIGGDVNFTDWTKLTGAHVYYTMTIGDKYNHFEKADMIALRNAIDAALADEERLISAEVKRMKDYNAKYHNTEEAK